MTVVDPIAVVAGYHERTKHRLEGYARGPETLDWDAQPDPFRRWESAPRTLLPLAPAGHADGGPAWSRLHGGDTLPPLPLTLAALAEVLELSLGLAGWKQAGPDRWAVRMNPSSGNLHPTEGWLLTKGVDGVADGVHHYAPYDHVLEQRAAWAPASATQAWIALSSLQWREAWKYGERAFRYCQLDTGHALGALRYAAALQGWQLQVVPSTTAHLAHLLGLDRDGDFGRAEREEPELLVRVVTEAALAEGTPSWPDCGADVEWFGTPNRVDRHPMYRWPAIDAVAEASRSTAAAAGASPAAPAHAAVSLPATAPTETVADMPARQVIRQRRSAQRFDARARMSLADFTRLLMALDAGGLPFDVMTTAPQVHVAVFAHRVDGLAPGAYLLPRSAAGEALCRKTLPPALDWQRVPDLPAELPLWRLAENPALAGTMRTLNCHQALGSDAIAAFALLGSFQPLPTPATYRDRLQEAGLVGHALYLHAEALGLRGTGIGCYFDDGLHQLLGIEPASAREAALQSLYHFTIGAPLIDSRIGSEPPYAHLPESRLEQADAAPR